MLISQRSAAAVVVAAIALAHPQASSAQQPEPLRLSAPPRHTLEVEPLAQAHVQTQVAQGELLDVDSRANSLTIKTQTDEMTFRYNDQTKVTGAHKSTTGLATMTGSQVTVMYRRDGSINLATNIEVRAQK